jgi:hypothetical protein
MPGQISPGATRIVTELTLATGEHSAPAALAWDGTKWTVLKVRAAKGFGAFFESVSCPVNGKCVVVGRTGAMDNADRRVLEWQRLEVRPDVPGWRLTGG